MQSKIILPLTALLVSHKMVESRLGLDSLIAVDSLFPSHKSSERIATQSALEKIYAATGGESWVKGDGWIGGDDHCDWEGVSCNCLKKVNGLNLAGFGLIGTLPTDIGSLNLINELDLSNNDIGGTIPTELGTNIVLKNLDLSNNSFSGNIPTELSQLIRLQTLAVQGNDDLSGGMPFEVCALHTAWISGVTDLAALENVYGDCIIGIVPCLCCTQGYNPCCFSSENNTVGTCNLD